MANIKISDLQFSGSELFSDRESFMNDLTENELEIVGGYQVYRLPIKLPLTTHPLPTWFPIDPYPAPGGEIM